MNFKECTGRLTFNKEPSKILAIAATLSALAFTVNEISGNDTDGCDSFIAPSFDSAKSLAFCPMIDGANGVKQTVFGGVSSVQKPTVEQ